tara:strand:+ start:183 stop:482 length:300 start_codon:yes stop_codon:yes gene_type:complete
MATLIQKGSKISEEHFSFLLSSEDPDGKHGPGRMKLTTAEAERFVQLINGMTSCPQMEWDTATDKNIMIKVSKIIDKARGKADTKKPCSRRDLPFTIKW